MYTSTPVNASGEIKKKRSLNDVGFFMSHRFILFVFCATGLLP